MCDDDVFEGLCGGDDGEWCVGVMCGCCVGCVCEGGWCELCVGLCGGEYCVCVVCCGVMLC